MALPQQDPSLKTPKDNIIATLENKLLDIETPTPIKFGNKTKTGYPKAKLEKICELLHQWKNTVGNNTNDKNELKEFIEKTKDKFYEKGIDLSNGYEYENYEGPGKQIQIVQMPFKANTKVTAYSKLEDRISAINLKLSNSDLPELKFDEGQLDQKYTLELLRNKNFIYMLQTDSTFKDDIKACCRGLDIQEKDSGMTSNNTSGLTTIVCTFKDQTTQVRGTKTFCLSQDNNYNQKSVNRKDIYDAGQVETKLGGGWHKAETFDNEDQMLITQLYKKLLEFNKEYDLFHVDTTIKEPLVTTLRSNIETLRSSSKKEKCKKLLQDHGFIDFLNANQNMDTVMEKTLSIAIERDGKMPADRKKSSDNKAFNFKIIFSNGKANVEYKTEENFQTIYRPLNPDTQSPAGQTEG